jgi:hypothetical protein
MPLTVADRPAADILQTEEGHPHGFGPSLTTRQLPEIAVSSRLVPVVGVFQYRQRELDWPG